MRPLFRALVIAAACLIGSAHGAFARDAGSVMADLVEKLWPAVVNISAKSVVTSPSQTAADPISDTTPLQESLGSGFIIDSEGFIVTNKHVVAGASIITVTLQDGSSWDARVVGQGYKADVALLKITGDLPFPTVKFGNSDNVRLGDPVLAIGNPLGLGGSVSSGIVSALNRDIMSTPFDDYIQTDAAINHGNSGGPLFNMSGEVIGVNTAIYVANGSNGSIGLGFAMTSNDAKMLIGQLKSFGRLRAGWIGVQAQAVTPEIADAFHAPEPFGAVLISVGDSGPAANVLREGDIIAQIGETKVRDARQLNRLIATSSGKPLDMAVWRDGAQQHIAITPREWPDEDKFFAKGPLAQGSGFTPIDPPNLGLVLAPLTDALRRQFTIPEGAKGVVVTGVRAGSAAARSGFLGGDLIERIASQNVDTPEAAAKLLDDLRAAGAQHIPVLAWGKVKGLRWGALQSGSTSSAKSEPPRPTQEATDAAARPER